MPTIEILDRRTMSDADALAIAELLAKVWPRRTIEERQAQLLGSWREYRGPEAEFPRSAIVREGDRMIAHAGGLPRTVGTSEGDMTIMALSRVCTDPTARGRKLGQAVVRAIFEAVDHGPFPYSLFQTASQVRPFYEQLGAGVVTNQFVDSLAEDPTANPFWDEVAMRYPAAKPWPSGEIDLRGPGW